jgi:hypothetical protein
VHAFRAIPKFARRVEPAPAVAPLIRPKWLATPELYADGCSLLFGTPAAVRHTLEASTNLVDWTTLAEGVSPAEVTTLVDQEALGLDFRTYRLSADGVSAAEILGYLRLEVPSGFSMLANPFLHLMGNRLDVLLPCMPERASISTFDLKLFKLRQSVFLQGRWSDPLLRLEPGSGAIIHNPESNPLSLVFAGTLPTGPARTCILPGFSICSAPLPCSGQLDTELGFPFSSGDSIHLFDPGQQRYVIHRFESDGVSPMPFIGKGESFWVSKTVAADWTFAVDPAAVR